MTPDRRALGPRLRRYSSARRFFVERNHDIRKTLLLVGSGRSGSTWLSEVLVEAFSCRLIFEPLRRNAVPLSKNVPWGSYVAAGEDDAEIHRVMKRILTGRIRNPMVDKFNGYRFPQRRLVKEIRPPISCPGPMRSSPRCPSSICCATLSPPPGRPASSGGNHF